MGVASGSSAASGPARVAPTPTQVELFYLSLEAQLMDELDKLQAELVQQQGQGGRRSPDRAGPRGSC